MSDNRCKGFKFGCTCSACLQVYFRCYANSHTYGPSDPRIPDYIEEGTVPNVAFRRFPEERAEDEGSPPGADDVLHPGQLHHKEEEDTSEEQGRQGF